MAREQYRLRQPHRINGELQAPGFVVALPDELGAWLVEQGIAECLTARPEVPALLRTMARPAPVRAVPTRPPPVIRRCCGWK